MTEELKRIETGVPRLDFILSGGLTLGNTYMLFGPPGSGKTILANQICFHLIKSESVRCLYVTLLAETHAKMFANLETLSFFKTEHVNHELIFLSAYAELRAKGATGFLALLRKSLRDHKPKFIVIDGLQAVKRACRHDGSLFDDFMHQLQALVSLTSCTALILSPHAFEVDSESIGVDGVLEFIHGYSGPRSVRELIVHKLRGSTFLSGKHEVEITRRGVQIHPRTEVQFSAPSEHSPTPRIRLPFGVGRFDAMLGGGLPSGTTTAIIGAPGTGKTLLSLSFLHEAAAAGFQCVYLGFSEPPALLMENSRTVGLDFEAHCKSGHVHFVWRPTLEQYLDSLAEDILERLKAQPTSRRCLIIDGFAGFRAAAVYKSRLPRFISAFANQLRLLDVTTLITDELDLLSPSATEAASDLSRATDNVILLRYSAGADARRRRISIVKMRGSNFDPSIADLQMDRGGLTVNRATPGEDVNDG